MPRRKTTGVYETRAELVENILSLARLHMTWDAIARRTGVSTATVTNIYYHPEKR